MADLITVAEAAKALAISSKQVRRLIDQGEIPVIPCGRGAKGDRIDPEDVDLYKRRMKKIKGQSCLSTNVVAFGGSRSRSAASELDNLLAPKRARKTPANSKPA